MTRILIKNGTFVTLTHPNRVLKDHGLLCENRVISRLAPMAELADVDADEVWDADGMVVLPGFINAHTHTYSSFARGLTKAAPAADFSGVLEQLWWRLDRKLTEEDVYLSALVSCIDAVRAGTTTMIDHHASPSAIAGSLDAVAQAVTETGLRASLCYEISERQGAQNGAEGLAENRRFLERLARTPNPSLVGQVGLHAPFTVGDALLRDAADLARSYDTGCHVHLAEDAVEQRHAQAQYGRSAGRRLADAGVLGPRTICAHCVHLDDDERTLLAQSNTIVTHQAQSNMNNAVGVMPLQAFLDAGILVGLGTDAMTHNMLEEVRVALWQQKLQQRAPSGAFPEVTGLLLGGNAAVTERLFPERIGCLAPGYVADLCIMDYRPYTPMTSDNFLGHLVFGLSQAAVDTTVAGGRVLMHRRRLLHLDEEAVTARARAAATRLWQRF